MNQKQLHQLHKYDALDTLVVISLYPKKGEIYSPGTTGVASYAKNLIRSMNRKVIVLADYDKKSIIYQEDNTLVIRCFSKNTTRMWLDIWNYLKQLKQAKTVLVQLDFSMYGRMLVTGMILPFLAIAKLWGYKVSVVSHHVVLDASKLSGHLGLGQSFIDKIKSTTYSWSFFWFYKMLGWVSESIFVLEETLRSQLDGAVAKDKIIAAPHAVDTTLTKIAKKEARKKLGISQDELVVMFFGFLNWFKGADLFADYFSQTEKLLGKKARFIMAGGASSTLREKSYYQHYLNSIENTIADSKQMEITGYIPQEKIAWYFSAADLVVFPYRYFMCASGVLSLVFSYQKPFIVSDKIGHMFEASDFKQAIKQANLHKQDLTFALNQKDCLQLTEKVLQNGLKAKMRHMAGAMRDNRSFYKTAALYENNLFHIQTKGSEVGELSLACSYDK